VDVTDIVADSDDAFEEVAHVDSNSCLLNGVRKGAIFDEVTSRDVSGEVTSGEVGNIPGVEEEQPLLNLREEVFERLGTGLNDKVGDADTGWAGIVASACVTGAFTAFLEGCKAVVEVGA